MNKLLNKKFKYEFSLSLISILKTFNKNHPRTLTTYKMTKEIFALAKEIAECRDNEIPYKLLKLKGEC